MLYTEADAALRVKRALKGREAVLDRLRAQITELQADLEHARQSRDTVRAICHEYRYRLGNLASSLDDAIARAKERANAARGDRPLMCMMEEAFGEACVRQRARLEAVQIGVLDFAANYQPPAHMNVTNNGDLPKGGEQG